MRTTGRSRASCGACELPRRGDRARARDPRVLLRGEEAGELHAIGRCELLEAQPRHLARGAHDAGRPADHRAAREHEVEAHDRTDRERADTGPDRETTDRDVLRDELALLAE